MVFKELSAVFLKSLGELLSVVYCRIALLQEALSMKAACFNDCTIPFWHPICCSTGILSSLFLLCSIWTGAYNMTGSLSHHAPLLLVVKSPGCKALIWHEHSVCVMQDRSNGESALCWTKLIHACLKGNERRDCTFAILKLERLVLVVVWAPIWKTKRHSERQDAWSVLVLTWLLQHGSQALATIAHALRTVLCCVGAAMPYWLGFRACIRRVASLIPV